MNSSTSVRRGRRCNPFAVLIPLAMISQLVPGGQPALELFTNEELAAVFAGESRAIKLVFRNPSERDVEADLQVQLFQTTAAVAVPLGQPRLWKHLRVLAGQTILETAHLDFPAVRAATPFLARWIAGTNQVLGTTPVIVYPPDLFKELKPLAGDQPLGVLVPDDKFKSLLQRLAVEFVDLAESDFGQFRGKLAIIGPFRSKAETREMMATQVQKLTSKGAAVVWIQPPTETPAKAEQRESIQPSFYAVPVGKGTVVVAQADLIADLSARPQAQLNLIQLARLALHPEPTRLPLLASQH